jgi:hypothetical protein
MQAVTFFLCGSLALDAFSRRHQPSLHGSYRWHGTSEQYPRPAGFGRHPNRKLRFTPRYTELIHEGLALRQHPIAMTSGTPYTETAETK